MRIYFLSITLILTFLLTSSTSAQSNSFNYSVIYVVSGNAPNALLLEAKDHLENELSNLGGVFSEQEGFLFLIGISEPSEKNQVALSVGVFNKIGEEIVELGKKEQAFYSVIEDEKKSNLPAESVAIREYVSEEYMRQFSMIIDNYVRVINQEMLGDTIKEIVELFSKSFIKKY